ncbi:MAG: hypothetical protein CVU95_04900 [Firmicutes bacterium HGW-Firmicutes-2]|jgi:signal transduction histidine kinase|nr:MAG: hypothetical protein CVU95_04900 [Firmicutes bacterium HGW-Firmicutes-2]
MSVNDFMPIIIPGAFMQVFIQAIYIKHCWHNHNLDQKKKWTYIVFIALFNLPAAAIYLFATRKLVNQVHQKKTSEGIERQIVEGIFICLVMAYEVLSLRVVTEKFDYDYFSLMILMLGISFILLIINKVFYDKMIPLLHITMPFVQTVMVVFIHFLGDSINTLLIVLVVIASVINNYPMRKSKLYIVFGFVLLLVDSGIKMGIAQQPVDIDSMIGLIYVNMLVYVLFVAAFYTLKKQIITNTILEKALCDLQNQSEKLEEMSRIAERNRITGEIHDSVGHLLTTAAIAIEAGTMLMDKEPIKANQKFELAIKQVRDSLTQIRNSIKAIRDENIEDFDQQLNQLADAVTSSTGLKINIIMDEGIGILPIHQKVLLEAIKECMTNSLKHGEATELDLLIQIYKNSCQMTISDNGVGGEAFVLGTGLNIMKDRVESLGGQCQFEGRPLEGFTVSILLPMGRRD